MKSVPLATPFRDSYRVAGCYAQNQRGLYYSLEREIAARFPFLPRYRSAGQPLLVTVRMRRSRAIVKLDRDERELIVINPRIVLWKKLPPKH